MAIRKRLLALTAVLLGLVWLEFGVASPWYHHGRTAVADAMERAENWYLLRTWEPPCESDGWTDYWLEEVALPVPECYSVWTVPSVIGSSTMIIATDPHSRDVSLTIHVMELDESGVRWNRKRAQDTGATILSDDVAFVWSVRPGERHAVVGHYLLIVEVGTPSYVPAAVRQRIQGQAGAVVGRFIRLALSGGQPPKPST